MTRKVLDTLEVSSPLLSTREFAEMLTQMDIQQGPLIRISSAELKMLNFINHINTSGSLRVIPSSDGPFPHVVETPGANRLDFSKSSRHFGLHTDGLYHNQVPE